jgi:1,4-alpha-glucan branching enzyme
VVLVLHSHLPYVLHHGRWPHGSDWLCEATVHSYLPLLEQLLRLEEENTPAPLTLGITPVLANQLADPDFRGELTAYFEHRIAAATDTTRAVQGSGETDLASPAEHWLRRYRRLKELFTRLDGNLVSAFRGLADRGRLELLGSAATHALLPLLGREESVRLQLLLGREEHRRIFGRSPSGCWLPECAYRPGLERELTAAGFRYFLADSHMARAGRSHEVYGTPHQDRGLEPAASTEAPERSPYRAYRLREAESLSVLVRDPVATRQVWSRYEGYPGESNYLEFHKIRWPEGIRLWRVSAPHSDLGDKLPYRPDAARRRAGLHARHFVALLSETARDSSVPDGAIVAPFDTELFGHWWHEGPEFLGQVWQVMAHNARVHPATVSTYLSAHPAGDTIALDRGSWGANGDFSMWKNRETEWLWTRLLDIEVEFWKLAPGALGNPAAHPALAQAAREMLLAESSDWPFIITTGAAKDYAERRFADHCNQAESLIRAVASGQLEAAGHRAAELGAKNRVFPDVLDSVGQVLR